MYKVLIVEDEDIIRKGLLFMVNWQDADCVVVGEAVDGLEGLEKIRETSPDIVVVDINSASGGVQAKARNASNYTTVVGYNRPYSGYYEIVGGTANVIYEEYKAVE